MSVGDQWNEPRKKKKLGAKNNGVAAHALVQKARKQKTNGTLKKQGERTR